MFFVLKLINLTFLHVKHHLAAYIFLFVVFIAGFITGITAIFSLGSSEALEINTFLSNLLKGLPDANINNALEIKNALMFNGGLLFLIWFSGLSVIGVPLILPIIFYKGYTLGFSIAFILSYQLAPGLLIVVFSILPQTMIFLPLMLIGGMQAALFSLNLIRGFRGVLGEFIKSIGNYSLRFSVLFSGVIISALFQGYFSPLILKLILNII